MSPRIQNAIDIFLDALNNGTLAKGDCTACAVGNLVRVGMGLTSKQYNCNNLSKNERGSFINWSLLFSTTNNRQKFKRKTFPKILEKYSIIKKQIEVTGFSVKELAKIEKAFELNTLIHFNFYPDCTKSEIRADQIKGLEAVVKVMLEFDEQTEEVSEVFTKKAELIAL